MPKLTSLTVDLRGNASSLLRATRTSLRAMRGLTAGISGTRLAVGGLVGAVAGLAGTAGLAALGRAAASNIDRQAKLATNLNTSTRNVQELQIAAELSGLKMRDLVQPIQQVSRVLGDALERDSKTAKQAFEALGISMEEARKLSRVELFERTIQELGKIQDQSKFATIANQLYAESWRKIRPLIDGYQDSIGRARVLTRDLGLGMSKEGAQGVQDMNDNMSLLIKLGTLLRDKVFSKLAPTINTVVVALGQSAEAFIRAQGGGERLANTIATKMTDGVRSLITVFGDLKIVIGGVFAAVRAVIEFLERTLPQIGKAIGEVVAVWAALARGDISGAFTLAQQELSTEAALGRLRAAQERQAGGDTGDRAEELKWLERQTRILEDIATKQFAARFQ